MAPVAPSGFTTKLWHPDSANAPILFERYQVLGIIGEGGMGTVFKGFHLNLKRPVAIKTLRIDHRKSPEMVSRFLKEMESVGQMDHPNVVRAMDAGEKNGVFYLVMEYLPGADLARLALRKGRLEVSTACELTRQAALGLDYIHKSLIHRDIKPSNLLLTTAGQVKILDLGLARIGLGEPVEREDTPYGCAVGTYAYMAPEQADALAEIDGRADLYSLGCTLYKLVTGHAPYSGSEYDSAAKVLYAHCHVPLTTVASFEDVPLPLRDVLLKMMAKKPADRYQTGKEVAAALAPFIGPGAMNASQGLADGSAVTEETPVQPLPRPLPAELSRLTDTPEETPVATPSVPKQIDVEQPRRRAGGRWWAGTGLLACVLAPLLWFAVVVPFRARNDVPEPPMRSLDELAGKGLYRLLDQDVMPIGYRAQNPLKWRWDPPSKKLDVKGPDLLLFPLGTTSRLTYTLEVAMTQAPWTGKIGVFWGYREKVENRNKPNPGKDVGTFQMLLVKHRRTDKEGDLYTIWRGLGRLNYDLNGELMTDEIGSTGQEVRQVLGEENILRVTISNHRLYRVFFAGHELDQLTTPQETIHYQEKPFDGPIGLIAIGHNVVYSQVYFNSP